MADVSDPPRPRVLVIDDEDGPRESIRMLLKPHYEVACATSVAEGEACLRRYRQDVVISDIRMPDVDGIEGLRRIRDIDPDVSVIMLTGYGTLETARSAMRLGANDYVKKPFDTREMMRVVEENARRTAHQRRKRESERNLRNLNEVLMGELEEKRGLALQGQASRELAHDLQNPLMIVTASVELLAEELRECEHSMENGCARDQAMEYLSLIEQSLERCTELLKVWRNLGRLEETEYQIHPLGEVLQKLRLEAEAMARDRGARFDFDVSEVETVRVRLDPVQFARAVMNLVGNALDALPDQGGRVELRGERDSDGVALFVADNGIGIPEPRRSKVFEPYFTTKEEGKGTGLGLFITRRILERHHGTIDVDEAPGGGARFVIRLPEAPPEDPT